MTVAIRRILSPVDFSEPSLHAQQFALELANKFGAELHLLYVAPPAPLPMSESNPTWFEADLGLKPEQIEELRKRLLKPLEPDWVKKLRTKSVVEVGFAVDEIIRYAKEAEIDLIVMATHGHTGIHRLLLGSVAEKVVRLAPCPVMTIHPKDHSYKSDSANDQGTSQPK